MTSLVDDSVRIYRDLAKLPSIKAGCILHNATGGGLQVQSFWSQRNLERKETVVFSRGHIVNSDVVIPTPSSAVNNEQWNKASPSGKLVAIVRKVKDKKGEDKQYIEIWSGSQQVDNIDVQAVDKHGKIYEDDQFGCLEWSHCESKLLYIAEKKSRKTKSYFDTSKPDTEPADPSKPVDCDFGDEYVYKEGWGEQLSEKYYPVVCVLGIKSGDIDVVTCLPDDVSPGQAVWCPDDLGFVCVGWWHVPYRLGLVYCHNRKSALFHVDLKAAVSNILGSSDRAVRSPVFSCDGSKLVYLDCEVGGPHVKCSSIIKLDWSSKAVSTVVDIVRNVPDVECPGIYTNALNKNCWLRDGRRIILDSHWRSRNELIVVDTETGSIQRLTNCGDIGCWQLLDVREDYILASCASPNQPQYLVIGHLDGDVVQWRRLDVDTPTIEGISWSISSVNLPHVNPIYSNVNYDYILLEPPLPSGSEVKPPLVVYPHGGPHSVFMADYSLYNAALVACGYAVLLVNYRGSYGFGQDNIESLLGHVGTQDINDIQHVVESVLNAGSADRERVVVMGGSHGGFLTAHLIGQFPTFYKAAVARNLVFNIASMFGISDIPDWCITESGGVFDDKMTGSPELYAEMWKRSPVVHIDKMKTPLMVMIGGKDLRVPPSQGLQLKRALQARNVPVRVLWYPECSHPITEVGSEADAFINIIRWFREHTSNKH